jgi:redox-sensing transcriptional repressor
MTIVPEPTRKRLVLLAQLLLQQKSERITSKTLQTLTGWSDTVIRRDILLLGFRGGVSNGYDVQKLRKAICSGLHMDENSIQRCCIVGLGRLGTALLENSFFENSSFTIVAGFDSSVNRTEILRSTFPLYPASRIESVIENQHISYAILTAPESEAQRLAERLEASGIRGIVNYTNEVLSLSGSVVIENVSPLTALTSLSTRLAGRN